MINPDYDIDADFHTEIIYIHYWLEFRTSEKYSTFPANA